MTTPATESFQIPIEAAEAYEAAFVPAFFAQWAPITCQAAGVTARQDVVDVACGTGIVARTARELVGPGGSIVGVDLNEAMLTVARRVEPAIEWRQGDVAALPLADRSFDIVLCQMALMFFPDRAKAVREMARVVRPGGTVTVLVPSRLEDQEAFLPFLEVVARHAGPEAMSLMTTYFACGDPEELTDLLASAGLNAITVAAHVGTYRAPSVDTAVATEVDSTPLRERITDAVYERIRADAHGALAPWTTTDGRLDAPFACLVAMARSPG